MMPRTPFQLKTMGQAVQLLSNQLAKQIARQQHIAEDAITQAPADLVERWNQQIECCSQLEREIKEELRSLEVDKAFTSGRVEMPATVAMPRNGRRKKQTTKGDGVDYGT